MADGIDDDTITQLKELMGERFPLLVETYLRNAEKYIAGVEAGLKEGDFQAVVDAAHPLKSSSGNLGLVKVGELAQQLEADAKACVAAEGCEAASISGLFEELKASFTKGKAFLQENV